MTSGFRLGSKQRLRESYDQNLCAALKKERSSLPMDAATSNILDAIEDRLVYHRDKMLPTHKRNGWLRYVMGIAIPAGAALTTWLTTHRFKEAGWLPASADSFSNPDLVGLVLAAYLQKKDKELSKFGDSWADQLFTSDQATKSGTGAPAG